MGETKIPKDALELSDRLYREGGAAEEALKAKCRWEHMGRCAVIIEWGNPRKWSSVLDATDAPDDSAGKRKSNVNKTT